MSESMVNGMGWMPDIPDFRDYHPDHEKIAPMLKGVGLAGKAPAKLASTQDLRAWCSPIENQGGLGSCTANAGVGLVEYFERKAFGNYIDASRLFLYKATRNLLGWNGDTGAFLRTTMGAMALFGVPPERYWAYTDASPDFDREPSAFCYSFAREYQAISYFRLDPPGTTPAQLLARIKLFLAAKLPSMFGFTVYSSIQQASSNGEIPFPGAGEGVLGGHAIVAVGYDDSKVVKNTGSGAQTKGALLIRNSWGTAWGVAGYGWLPYDYVMHGLAQDWWSLWKASYTNTKQFGL
ncbi:MAG TPA: C1 family peptidase [Mariprofundaceae bacterium]|nr:C1 family peptidase [Mariprofundaceae bacterium]